MGSLDHIDFGLAQTVLYSLLMEVGISQIDLPVAVYKSNSNRERRSITERTSDVALTAAMEEYAQGNGAAFGRVYRMLAPRILVYLRRHVRSAARAEDLLQETLLRVHRAKERFVPGAPVMPWVITIARRLVFDEFRHANLSISVALQDACEWEEHWARLSAGSEEELNAKLIACRVRRTLRELPSKQRTAYELVMLDGLSHAEAAQALGTTVCAIKLRVHRVYSALGADIGS